MSIVLNRTNNLVESYHHKLNNVIEYNHPRLSILIEKNKKSFLFNTKMNIEVNYLKKRVKILVALMYLMIFLTF